MGASKQMASVGAEPPDLSAVDQNGVQHHLSETRGSFAVVYFYPKDGTPGCTKEACAFRDIWKRYEAARVKIFGVSTDDQRSKDSFAKEHKLPFPILADPDGAWVKAFGVPTTLGMASRVTFVLAPDGKIARVYPSVDPGVHAEQVLGEIVAMKGL